MSEKYYKGLTRKKKQQRKKEIQKFGSMSWKNPKAYVGFQTNKGVKTRKSKYTKAWKYMFPDAKSLADKAKATGIPLPYIKKSYNRGMAAWRTGHRPGATQQQWGHARASSFLLCGKTHYTADADLVRKTRKNPWWAKQGC